MGKFIDLTGKKFGLLTVKEKGETKNGKTYWNCLCECGKLTSIRSDSLISGRTTSCGCLHNKKARANHKDLTGMKFGRLTAVKIEDTQSVRGRTWICNCDCGKNNISVCSNLLLSGHKKSCGCLQEEYNKKEKTERIIDLSNKRFGRLTVLEIDGKKQGGYYWKCKCDCIKNKIISVSGANLRSGHTRSCGCLNSKGEELISQILWKHNIKFIKQYSFDNLRTDLGNKMKFDFGILDNDDSLLYLIEFDGLHHFEYRDSGWNNKEHYEETIKRDNIKNEFCDKNNIYLLRIPYLDINNITIDMLIPTQFKHILRKEDEKCIVDTLQK